MLSAASPHESKRAPNEFEPRDAQVVVLDLSQAQTYAHIVQKCIGRPRTRYTYAYQGVVRAARCVRDVVNGSRYAAAVVSYSLALFWWRNILKLAEVGGFSALESENQGAYRVFARWVAGVSVWRACTDALAYARVSERGPMHPELLYMEQFDTHHGCSRGESPTGPQPAAECAAEYAEDRLKRVEAAEAAAARHSGTRGFVRFCSRNADALCDIDLGEIQDVLSDLQKAMRDEEKARIARRNPADPEDVSNTGSRGSPPRRRCTRYRSFLSAAARVLCCTAMCCASGRNGGRADDVKRTQNKSLRLSPTVSSNRAPVRKAYAVYQYIEAITVHGAPLIPSRYGNPWF